MCAAPPILRANSERASLATLNAYIHVEDWLRHHAPVGDADPLHRSIRDGVTKAPRPHTGSAARCACTIPGKKTSHILSYQANLSLERMMERLLKVGFEQVGTWALQSETLVLKLDRMASSGNVLYAFAVSGEVKYIGKTTQPLLARLMGYARPAPTQATNLRNHANLKQVLRGGRTVEILALPDTGLMRYGEFHLNLAAGLEDSLIASLRPEWNGQRSVPLNAQEEIIARQQDRPAGPAPVSMPQPTGFQATGKKTIDLLGELHSRVGKTFVTLGHRNPFALVSVDGSRVLVRPAATETTRAIPWKQIRAAFDHMTRNGSITLHDIRAYSEMNPVYVAALFADLPGVIASTRPIVLQFTAA